MFEVTLRQRIKRVFAPKGKEIAGYRKLYNEEFVFYILLFAKYYQVIKSRMRTVCSTDWRDTDL
jgi:hypothetical protein